MCFAERVWYYLDQYWDDIGDPRMNEWILIKGGIWRIIAIMSLYLLITRYILPKWMKNKEPFELRNVMFCYNLLLVFVNLFFFYWSVISINGGKIFFDFQYPNRDDRSPTTLWYLNLGWYVFVSRFVDLLDTVFFVLRKKESQVTSLHLYHHTMVPIACWVSYKYNAMIPMMRMFALVNTAIHTLMYGYYALAAFGPKVSKYLWWKKYITILQMIQFAVCGGYGAILFVKQTDYPMDWFYFVVLQNPLFIYMFYDFYKQTYNNDSINKEKTKKSLQ